MASQLAAALAGAHVTSAYPEPHGDGWYASCCCGWRSMRATDKEHANSMAYVHRMARKLSQG